MNRLPLHPNLDRDRFVPEKTSGPNFNSFFAAGFECSTHRLRSGTRLDMIAATQHDKFAHLDYQRLQQAGLRVAREGVRWHLVEAVPGRYDFSSVLPIVRAARAADVQVIWDLCHFGWPDHLDLFQPEFRSSLAHYGAAFAEWLARELQGPSFFVPVNEISFFSWAAGDEGSMYPFVKGRGLELKAQLVRAAIQTMEAVWSVAPTARFMHVDPVIHVVAHPRHPEQAGEAEAYRRSQFQAWDMLSGRLWPELGGNDKYLDLIGVNFYPYNQWFYDLEGVRRVRKFRPLTRRHLLYRPFRDLLKEVSQRYASPLFIAETGAENRARASWFRYINQEAEAASLDGARIEGLCLYPILNHPGWLDSRHCHNGLWDYPSRYGQRNVYAPLATELRRWQHRRQRDGIDEQDQERGPRSNAFRLPSPSHPRHQRKRHEL
ncbi:Beta-glucosidase/6-phospho-beta-glucosidase/beta-galactosidase [Verrucomicrobia bacterium]|nr:Beta-glucosidase/6-phospho-beta-glucosidase/beta-galactosidase [Verrucomicrobiota bacterium]